MFGTEMKIKKRDTGDQWPDDSDIETANGTMSKSTAQPTTLLSTFFDPNSITWHIPRPSLVGHSEKDSDNGTSWVHSHVQHNLSSRSCTSSQGSTASTHSAASNTLLLTTANLENFTAATQQPIITSPKSMDTASIASSTHFTVINGLGKPTIVNKKSWCARNQLTFLVCTMSALFMIGLLIVILYMEMRVHDKYD